MNKEEAEKLLDVKDGYEISDLKRAYRRVSFLNHPDYGGSEEKFNYLTLAFEYLKKYVINKTGITRDGTDLSTFGNGLPLNVSAKYCDNCDGKGYKTYHEKEYKKVTCSECEGDGAKWSVCRGCGGTGKFRLRSGKIVVCRVCNGSMKFYYIDKRMHNFFKLFEISLYREINGKRKRVLCCKKCHGEGMLEKEVENEIKFHIKCGKCNGCGEIEIHNPVLPRGYLA